MAKKPQLRYWNTDEIQPLPKRLYKSVYGEQYNDSWRLRPASLSNSEKETLRPILESNKFENIYLIPEVEIPQKTKTPDLLINDRRVEIKSVSSKRSIENQTLKAYKQTGDSGLIIYDISKSQLAQKEIVGEISKRCLNKQIAGFIISNKKKLVSVSFLNKEKTGYSSASYATNEGSLFLGSILAQKPQKVNKKPKLRTQTHTYWQKRSIERTLKVEHDMLPYLHKSRHVYTEASRNTARQVQAIYDKYYRDNGFNAQALRELAPQGDVRRLKARMRKLGLETNLPHNYAYRVSHLEILNMQMRAEAYEAGQKIKQLTGKSLAKTYENGYYRTIYDTAKGIGHTPAFSRLNKETISKVLDAKNYGKNFSERIWGRSQKLGDELQSIIGTAIATGQSPAKTARLIRERFNVSASSAERLIRTETNYFENQAEIDAYKEMGVGEYQFLATIDTRTSEVCQGHDHKTYKVSEAKVGVNIPPLHPNCRSTITPYFDKEWEPEIRIARNPQTGRNEYVTNMSYEEWLGKITDGTINGARLERNIVNSVSTMPASAQPVTSRFMTEKVHKEYIGDRSHLLPFIQDLWAEKDPMAQGFAKILSGTKKKVAVGEVSEKSKRTLLRLSRSKIKTKDKRMVIRLSRSYLLHMDNSGHFTGFRHGKYGHDDKNPLSVDEIKNISKIINGADKNNTLFKGYKRGTPRLSIIGKTNSNQMVLVEIDKNGNFVDVVTSYKLTKQQWSKMQIDITKQNTAL